MKDEKGVSLVEVLVAIALLGVIAVPFLMGLSTAFKANLTANSQSTALSLAQSQIEYLKSQPYATPATNGEAIYPKISPSPSPSGYSIWSINRAGTPVPDIIGIAWNTGNNQSPVPFPLDTPVPIPIPTSSPAPGTYLQKITVVIMQGTKEVARLDTYKVKLTR